MALARPSTAAVSNAFFMPISARGRLLRRLLSDAIELKFMTKPLTKLPSCELLAAAPVSQPFAILPVSL